MHVGIADEPLVEEVDEPLEGLALLGPVERPERPEGGLAVLEEDDAVEVLEPARRLVERVALDVVEDVALGRARQELEPAALDEREEVEDVLPGQSVAVLELRLAAEAPVDLRAELGLELLGRGGELLERCDAGLAEAVDPAAAHVRDEAEVVVCLPLLRAALEPGADRAVRDRVRVSRRRVGNPVEEAAADAPVVGVEVADAVARALVRAEDDVHTVGQAALDAADLLAVEGELEQEVRLGRAGELRVGDLVGAVSLPLEEIRDPAPAGGVEEDCLVDDVGAVAHRLFGGGRRALPVIVELDPGDGVAGRLESGEVRGLVLLALAADEVTLCVFALDSRKPPARYGQLERRQVLALEEVIRVRGRESEAAIATLH